MLRKNFTGRKTLRRLVAGVAVSDSEMASASAVLGFTKGRVSSTTVPERKARGGVSRPRVDAASKLLGEFS